MGWAWQHGQVGARLSHPIPASAATAAALALPRRPGKPGPERWSPAMGVTARAASGHGLRSPLPAPAPGTQGTQTVPIPGLYPAPRACLSFPSSPGEPGVGLRMWEHGRDGLHQIFGYLFASRAGSAPQGINPWPQRGLLRTWGRLSSRKRIKQRTGNVGMGSDSPRAALASGGDKGTVLGTGTRLGTDTDSSPGIGVLPTGTAPTEGPRLPAGDWGCALNWGHWELSFRAGDTGSCALSRGQWQL